MSSFITQQVKDIQKEKEMSEIGWEYICDEKLSELFINISRKIHHRNTFNSEKYASVAEIPYFCKIITLRKQLGTKFVSSKLT